MKKFSPIALAIVLAAVLFTTGCTLSVGSTTPVNQNVTGGIFRTNDLGVTWQQLGLIKTTAAQKLNIFGLDTSVLKVDPSDPKAIYMGSFADGLFYSYDSGISWSFMSALGQKAIIDLAIDPKNKCIIYVATVGRIFKTTDCGRAWQEIYSDNEKTLNIYSVIVDSFNSNIVYMANARGDVVKSQDAGKTWRTVQHFAGPVRKMIMDPKDSRSLLALVENRGIFKTANGGADWQDLTPQLTAVKADKGFRDLIAAPSASGYYLLAVNYGLFKTANNGQDWTAISLIPPDRDTYINAIAVSPTDTQAIYYVTDTTFYATIDGGQNWSSRKLPTARNGSALLAGTAKDGMIYVGLKTK